LAQNLAGIGAKTAAFFWIGFLLGDQCDSAIEADGENIIAVFQVRIGLAVLDVRAETTNARNDRLAVFRRQSDFARQRQKDQRFFEINVFGRNAFWNTRALRLLDLLFLFALLGFWRLDLFAELQVGPEAAATQRDFEAGCRVFAQHLLALNAVGARRDLSGE